MLLDPGVTQPCPGSSDRREIVAIAEMTTRRDGDRKDRDRDEYPNKRQPVREAAPSTRVKLDEFFLDGEGIDRQVLQSSICRFLGAEATSRPFEYQVC